MIKVVKTAVNAKTWLPAEDCVPWTLAVLFLVGVVESGFKVLLWLVSLTEPKSIQRKEYYHR